MSESSDRLLRALPFPAGIEAGSVTFDWQGPDAHLAPLSATPLSEALKGKTNCGLVLLLAGSLLWTARRLARLTDAAPCVYAAETLLCWQSSPLYYDPDGPKQFQRPMPVQREAAMTVCRKAAAIFMISPGRHIADPPIQLTENVIALTRFILGPELENPFRDWVRAVIDRLNALAPNPWQDFRGRFDFATEEEYLAHKARNMGEPLPIEVANPETPVDPAALPALYDAFLERVDWAANPYLRSPDALREAGFSGTPYRRA